MNDTHHANYAVALTQASGTLSKKQNLKTIQTKAHSPCDPTPFFQEGQKRGHACSHVLADRNKQHILGHELFRILASFPGNTHCTRHPKTKLCLIYLLASLPLIASILYSNVKIRLAISEILHVKVVLSQGFSLSRQLGPQRISVGCNLRLHMDQIGSCNLLSQLFDLLLSVLGFAPLDLGNVGPAANPKVKKMSNIFLKANHMIILNTQCPRSSRTPN